MSLFLRRIGNTQRYMLRISITPKFRKVIRNSSKTITNMTRRINGRLQATRLLTMITNRRIPRRGLMNSFRHRVLINRRVTIKETRRREMRGLLRVTVSIPARFRRGLHLFNVSRVVLNHMFGSASVIRNIIASTIPALGSRPRFI